MAPSAWRDRVERAAFAELAGLPWILTPPVSSLRVLCDAMFARHGVSPVTRVSADNEDLVRALVLAGVGIAVMRDDDARSLAVEGRIVAWEGERLPCTLRFVWNRRRAAGPDLRAVIGLVQAAWAPSAGHGRAADGATPRAAKATRSGGGARR